MVTLVSETNIEALIGGFCAVFRLVDPPIQRIRNEGLMEDRAAKTYQSVVTTIHSHLPLCQYNSAEERGELTAFKAKLRLQELVEGVIIFARVCVVFLIVRAHHGGNAGLDSLQELWTYD